LNLFLSASFAYRQGRVVWEAGEAVALTGTLGSSILGVAVEAGTLSTCLLRGLGW
jgi:hypothetical protein